MERSWRREVIRPGGCILLAFAVLILPLRWVLGWILAAVAHESFHLLAIRLCGGRIVDFQIGADGAIITASDLSAGQSIFCSLAGPIGALLLLSFSKWLPAIAVCAVFQSAYNMLPIEPLDGGLALYSLMSILFPQAIAEKICAAVKWICLSAIAAAAAYAAIFLNLGWLPLIFAFSLLAKRNFGKIPCKPCRKRVQ